MARHKLTLEIVKERLKDINPNIEILSDEYINSKTKLKCRCLIDGHEWGVKWSDLSQGTGCRVCHLKSRTLTFKTVRSRLKEINPNIEILSEEYVNSKTKLRCRCLIDNYEWSTTWSHLSQGKGCPKCAGTVKPTLKEVKDKLERVNPYIEILSNKYVNARTHLKCKCLIDGHEWSATWDSLQSGSGCPMCGGRPRLDIEMVKDRVCEINPDIEILSDEYFNAHEKLKCKCLTDGYEWSATWDSLSRGQGCPMCASRPKLDMDIVKEKIREINSDIEILSDEYVNNNIKLRCKCLIDGHEWDASWSNLSRGYGCPRCSSSKGERKITGILTKYDLIHDVQFTFDDCRNKLPLPFDSAVFNNRGDLKFLVEYDGRQHFEPVDFAGKGEQWARKQYEGLVMRDNIKNQYCKDNNIPLLRIPYWDFDNIESILEKWLANLELIEDSTLIAN